MSDGAIGMIVLVAISIASAFISHKQIKSFMLAVIVSTLASVILFQVVAYIQLGHLDPFFPIAMAVSGFIAFFISLVIGYALGRGNKKTTFQEMRKDIDEAE